MPGRPSCADAEAALRGFGTPVAARRRIVLRETLSAFECADPPDRYHCLARQNLERWRRAIVASSGVLQIEVVPGDWGGVTAAMTRRHGTCFAVLNMANAHVPGGAYVEGAAAQEENLFRRTDCHFRIGPDDYDAEQDRYRSAMTRLLSAEEGRVYLDTEHPRVCIRGPEDRTREDLGYPWLREDALFPFYELRAAAQDLRSGSRFDAEDARRRIRAQLRTLSDHGIRHAVLGAFGCGAFRNPARHVAEIYREEIAARRTHFSVIAFAVFDAGYGPDNFTPFAETFGIATE
jgi:hypothetical protein